MKQNLRVIGLLILMLPCVAGAQSREEASAELEAVQERIESLQAELKKESRRRSRAERELADVEKSELKMRSELAKIRTGLSKSRSRQAELEKQSRQQRTELEKQRAVLQQQIRIAYINGGEEWLRVALSQQDAGALGRRMTYYAYLSRQRSETIDGVAAKLVELEVTRSEIQNEMNRLAALESEAAEKLSAIADTREERADLVKSINVAMQSKDVEIDRLQAQATELTELVRALAKVVPKMPQFDSGPFAGQADRLEWPVEGKVVRRFGTSRADGRLKWEGVLLDAPAGTAVRSVYHGRVVFSDWLDGMGLLAIIDHGGGFMSLYGHNQALLKEVGEWVRPGDSIAYVGDSGGQAKAGLYFEIRKDGEPVNPSRWIK